MRPTSFGPSRKVLVITLFVSWSVLWKIKMEILSVYLLLLLLLLWVAQSCPTLCDPMDCSVPGFLHHIPRLFRVMSTELVMPSNQLILWRPLSSCPQSFPASGSFPMSQWCHPTISSSVSDFSSKCKCVCVCVCLCVCTQEMSFQRGRLTLLPVQKKWLFEWSAPEFPGIVVAS